MKQHLLALSIVTLTGCATRPPLDQLDYGHPISAEEALQAALRFEQNAAADPDAIRVKITRGPAKGGTFDRITGETVAGYKVCYAVNGKNLYGGYVGFQTRFMVVHDGFVHYHAVGNEAAALCAWARNGMENDAK